MKTNIRLTLHQHAFLSKAVSDSAAATLDFACRLFVHPEGTMKSRQAGGGLIASCDRLGLGKRLKAGGYLVNAAGRAAVEAGNPRKTATPMNVPGAKGKRLKGGVNVIQVVTLHNQGKSVSEIAAILGVHRSTVSRALVATKAPSAKPEAAL